MKTNLSNRSKKPKKKRKKTLLPGAFYHVPKTNYVVTADANLIACKCCLTKTLIYISKRASPKWGIHNLALFHHKDSGVGPSPRSRSPIMLKRLCGANCLGIFCTASLYMDRASYGSSKNELEKVVLCFAGAFFTGCYDILKA